MALIHAKCSRENSSFKVITRQFPYRCVIEDTIIFSLFNLQILTSGSVWKKRMNDFRRREQRKIVHHFPLFYMLFVLSEEGNKRLHRSSIRWLIANCRRHRRRSRDCDFFQFCAVHKQSDFNSNQFLLLKIDFGNDESFKIFQFLNVVFFKSFTIFIRFISHFLVSSFLLHQNLCILSVQSYNIYNIQHPRPYQCLPWHRFSTLTWPDI